MISLRDVLIRWLSGLVARGAGGPAVQEILVRLFGRRRFYSIPSAPCALVDVEMFLNGVQVYVCVDWARAEHEAVVFRRVLSCYGRVEIIQTSLERAPLG